METMPESECERALEFSQKQEHREQKGHFPILGQSI